MSAQVPVLAEDDGAQEHGRVGPQVLPRTMEVALCVPEQSRGLAGQAASEGKIASVALESRHLLLRCRLPGVGLILSRCLRSHRKPE